MARARDRQKLAEDFEDTVAAANERSDTPEAQAVQEGIASLLPVGKGLAMAKAVLPAAKSMANKAGRAISARASQKLEDIRRSLPIDLNKASTCLRR